MRYREMLHLIIAWTGFESRQTALVLAGLTLLIGLLAARGFGTAIPKAINSAHEMQELL